jgi:autotransporter adhesin
MATGILSKVASHAEGGTAYGAWTSVTGSNGTAIGYRSLAGVGSVAIGFQNQAIGTQSIAIGFANVVSGNNSGALGDPNIVSGNGSYAIGNNNHIASNNVFVLGNNVTAGIGNDGAVVLGNNSTASGPNSVSVGAAGNERRITNVAPGIAGTDAVNVSQLNGAVLGLSSEIFDLRRSVGFGVAGATALAMIPSISPDQRYSVGLGFGGYDGYQAIALGFNGRLDNSVTVRAGASISNGKSTYGAGISLGW